MSNNKFASKCSENVANIISVWKVNKCLTPYLAVTTVVTLSKAINEFGFSELFKGFFFQNNFGCLTSTVLLIFLVLHMDAHIHYSKKYFTQNLLNSF